MMWIRHEVPMYITSDIEKNNKKYSQFYVDFLKLLYSIHSLICDTHPSFLLNNMVSGSKIKVWRKNNSDEYIITVQDIIYETDFSLLIELATCRAKCPLNYYTKKYILKNSEILYTEWMPISTEIISNLKSFIDKLLPSIKTVKE